MDEQWVHDNVISGIRNMGMEVSDITLWCNEELENRWLNDTLCEWRTEEWLKISKKSLAYFLKQENVINTNSVSIEKLVDMIMAQN